MENRSKAGCSERCGSAPRDAVICEGCRRATRLWGAAARIGVMSTYVRRERIYCRGVSRYSFRRTGLRVRMWDLLVIV